jgi:hypothetical protein
MKRIALLLVTATACIDEATEPFDDAVADTDGKADAADARHYLLTSERVPGDPEARTLRRAGGGKLRCPDGEVAEACAIVDFETTPGLSATAAVLLDEVEDHPIILRGRIVKRADERIVLRVSAATRGITSVDPTPSICYRLRPTTGLHYRFERLDTAETIESWHLYFDDVDPTPDFWGQPTPAVQAKIDDALRLAATRPVYSCGGFETREGEAWFWGSQVFAPK